MAFTITKPNTGIVITTESAVQADRCAGFLGPGATIENGHGGRVIFCECTERGSEG